MTEGTYHPPLYPGVNSAGFALDEVNGAGVNDTLYTSVWDSIKVPSPTGLDPDDAAGQTVDVWVRRQRRLVYVPRERRRDRAAGRRGVEVAR